MADVELVEAAAGDAENLEKEPIGKDKREGGEANCEV
jgi:hypothetical protein